MAKVELRIPKMGESIMEVTILKWLKKVGEHIEADESILEIATDKVDSEVPSPVEGIISEIKGGENDVVKIGEVVAIITTEQAEESIPSAASEKVKVEKILEPVAVEVTSQKSVVNPPKPQQAMQTSRSVANSRFLSPLVRKICSEENISHEELDSILGSGKDGRITKKDVLNYISNRGAVTSQPIKPNIEKFEQQPVQESIQQTNHSTENVEIIEMDRMRKLIAKHMVHSKQVAPHVTSFTEVDVTPIVKWRESIKNKFVQKYNEKITYTPVFIEACVKALLKYPMINVSVQDDKILLKKHINIGMATALPSGNLIVPVIKNADYLNMIGLAKSVNDLASRARENKLSPEDIQGGTFTISNIGAFGSLMGTPIINQPEVAIMALGAIKKKAVVIEKDNEDLIAVRHMMFMSMSYDHRIVDGALGTSFMAEVKNNLEAFDPEREV